MGNRLDLHDLLLSIAGPNVYFQAPSNINMKYPAIRYSVNKIGNTYANNIVYNQNLSYSITVISRDVEDSIVDEISKLPTCSFDRQYISDNLYHTVFNIYY